jgi:hypothetical protein
VVRDRDPPAVHRRLASIQTFRTRNKEGDP